MKTKQKVIGNDSTFTNFNITNKKSNIASKVEQMNLTEYNDIKIFTSTFLPSHIKNNNELMKKNIDKFNSNKNNLNFPLMKRNTKHFSIKKTNNVKFRSNPFFSNIKNKILFSINKKYNRNNINKKPNLSLNQKIKNIINDKENHITRGNPLNNILSKGKSESFCHKKNNIKNVHFNNNNILNKEKYSFININIDDNKNNIINNNIFKNNRIVKNNSIDNKYFRTYNNKDINNNNINKDINLFKTKCLNLQNKNYKFQNNINYNYKKNADNLNKNLINQDELYKATKALKKNLNYWKLLDIEQKFNNKYNDNVMKLKEKNKIIKKIKEKCKIILEETDKQNNYEIQTIIRDIKDQLLGLGFNEFYRYLLTLLKNYDKKIVNWSFDIVEENKECPEELKFKNVRNRHKKFMGMLNRQFVDGINVNNQMDNLIRNSKNKLGFDNNDNYDKYFFNNINNNNSQDKYKYNIFTQGNYRSKFYEKFQRNNNNNN